MRFYNILNKLILIVIFLTSALSSICQLNTLSPYSRFGIGDLEQGTSVFSNNLGGSTVALTPFMVLNYENPASYPYIISSTFQTSLNYEYTQIENSTITGNSSKSKLKEIAIGAPFAKNCGFSAGFSPYSVIGYEFSESSGSPLEETSGIFEYQGNGGFTKAFVGFGRKSTKYGYWVVDRGPEIGLDSVKYMTSALSLGLNLYNVFGTAQYERNLFFNDFSSFYHRLESSTTSITKGGSTIGFIFKKGFTPQFELRGNDVKKLKQINLQLGGTFDSFFGDVQTDNTTKIFNAFTQSTTSATLVADTILLSENVEGSLKIPYTLTLGAAISIFNTRQNSLELSIQYRTQDWSNFTNSLSESTPDLYGASSNFSAGLQFTPKPIDDDKANFLQRSMYQIGIRQNLSYLNLEGQKISENRIGLGCSIPFLKSKTLSRINLGMDFGFRGTTDNGLIKETSVNAYLGFSLMPNLRLDKWFKQSKYQ